MNVSGKAIAVLGLARSGESVARLLLAKGAHVTVLDSGSSQAVLDRAAKLRTIGVNVFTGQSADCKENFDLIVVSPGIELATPFVRQFSKRNIPITGELEIAWRYCERPVIAITGTNGKTTTTELISNMLNSVGKSTIACGNIGLPFSEVVSGSLDAFDVITLEVSSFQLETIDTFRPQVALWLNFSPDHLDRHSSMEEYRAAKMRIFENQTPEDFAICNAADAPVDLRASQLTFSCAQSADFTLEGGTICFDRKFVAALDLFQLKGLHNAENLMAALATAQALGLSFASVLPALQKYIPAPHRCELVAVVDGVRYINDSKATNTDAMARALASEEGKVILIAGGKDKGFEFGSLCSLISEKVEHAILIGEIAGRIANEWAAVVPCQIATTLQEAVFQAHTLAIDGSTVLFSPGTSSFDMFRDYADRGEQFREAARNLSNLPSIQT